MKYLPGTALIMLWMTSAIHGYSQIEVTSLTADNYASASTATVVTPGTAAPTPYNRGSRWLELNTFSTSLRYRSTATTYGVHLFDYGQHRELLDGRFNLDPSAKYSVNFHVSSGRYFNWAYADSIGGQFSDLVAFNRTKLTPTELKAVGLAIKNDPDGMTYSKGIVSRGGYIFVRQLYATASPIEQVTFEFGSLPIEHGVNTEITSFDDDAYIAGERLRLHDPHHLYFDEVSATSAYLGDPFKPNFFVRGQRLGNSNYQQYLFKKKFSRHIVASTDYTHLRNTHTVREAVAFKLPRNLFLDGARAELYQRLNDVVLFGASAPGASGFAVDLSKSFKAGLGGEIGYASIDNNYAAYSGSSFLLAVKLAWNSDSFMNGKHPYAKVNWKVAPGLTLNGFYTHIIGVDSYGVSGQTLEAGFNYDIADVLHHKNIF